MVLDEKWPLFQLFFSGNIGQENVFWSWFWSKNGHFSNFLLDIFPKGLTHGFGREMAIFPSFFFQAIIFYNEKTPFQAIKTRSSKGRKIDIFPKGLTHGFGRKNGRFNNFFFWAIQARKISFMIFQNEKRPLQAIKTRSSKSRKI